MMSAPRSAVIRVLGFVVLVLCAAAALSSDRGPVAATGNSITTPDTNGVTGLFTSMRLDAAGNPVIAYQEGNNRDLRVMHCNDRNCTGGDESITTPDSADDTGWYISLRLDSSGNPVVAYLNLAFGLTVLHCNDPDCAPGGDVIVRPDEDPTAFGGFGASLALDASGNPVVSYLERTGHDLRILHCNDPDCVLGGESVTIPDVVGDSFWTSIALDAGGNPVVSYFYATSNDLRILHCGDPNCTNPLTNSITTPDAAGSVGPSNSLQLDSAGHPVVSYYDATNSDLKLLNCDDPNCAGTGDSITSPDTVGSVGGYTSLALDAAGNPVVSYYDFATKDLKLIHCNDPDCSGGGESITTPDTDADVGRDNSIVIDSFGNPLVSYLYALDGYHGSLKLLHCADANCAGMKPMDTDGDGCSDAREQQTSVGSEFFGGRRDYLNPWDYFNPTHDGQNRVDDILAVLQRFGKNYGDPGYSTDFDRTYIGPNPWNLGPPNGQVRIDDVIFQIHQYRHDCQ